ncbi:hypothetical protein MesoLjLc_65580 [Mesorhizobium sp. L-8-10]|uniref:DUF2167 domain-containing protein n=1 Tax=Mesorhizobium sp. L-8-10 TaxID=2744523 RepID=UPI001925401D|nr:DUF2167 domain-containing protein [Mesorhizobium sp. L-8-10]BCH34628.1 hypothetical protein MesoLjLc_65580 [Mesorhizobium sp. L-8-10]
MKIAGILFCVAIFLWNGSAKAEKSAEFFATYGEYNAQGRRLLDNIEPKTGLVELPDGVRLDLRGKFYYLDREDAVYVLTEMWGNPPTAAVGTLGMVFPIQHDPLGERSWGIKLEMDKIGYVDDTDAASIDYDELLRDMKAEMAAANEARVKDGFPAITLLGWASPPVYDSANKRLHWARELQFGDDVEKTLNYDVRFLGREGVFIMGYIAGMGQLPEIKQSLDEVLALPSFAEGKRYSDYVPGADTVAAVGVGGLIAGKAAIKTGLVAVALVFLKKFGVFLLVPLLWIWRVIRGKSASS